MKTTDTRLIRYDQIFHFSPTEQPVIQALLIESQQGLPYPGDNFTAGQIADSQPWLISSPVSRESLGFFSIKDGFHLTGFYIRPPYRKYGRQILEQLLGQFNIHYAFVRSWDHHNLPFYLEFLRRTELQAHQFQLLDPRTLAQPLPWVRIRLARPADLPFLEAADFLTNPASYVRRQELWIARNTDDRPVGIGVIEPHAVSDDYMDIGMYTIPGLRERGVGRTILILLSQLVLDSGRTPVAGCYYKNHVSRRTLESAGFDCIGSIFRFSFDGSRLKELD